MKLLVTITIALCISLKGYTQMAIGYFPFQSLLSVSANTQKTIWAECKVETNTFFSNLNTEFSAKYTIKNNLVHSTM
jgi:outer membrane receptor for ferric coprogen and ferric-rhodotorulic acid